MEANSTINLVPFGIGITELWMPQLCCSCQYTHSVCMAPFSWAAGHTTMCLYTVVNNQFDRLGNQRFLCHDISVFKDVSISIFHSLIY